MLITLPIGEVLPATPRARIVRFELNGESFDFSAGQAVLVGAPEQRRRPYSLANSPEDARELGYLELLVGVDAGGQAGPHLPLEPGTRIDVEGPVGSFTFPAAPAENRLVFVAGGTGIAPLRAMLRHALAARLAVDHVGLLYSARTPDDFAYADEFQSLARHGAIDFRQTITRDGGSDWSGQRGRITRDTLDSLIQDRETLCFVCGPVAMVDEVPKLLQEIGVERRRIRVEEW